MVPCREHEGVGPVMSELEGGDLGATSCGHSGEPSLMLAGHEHEITGFEEAFRGDDASFEEELEGEDAGDDVVVGHWSVFQ
jgi:hypothetical protein